MTAQPNTGPRMRYQLMAATFARLVVNTAHRMVYPFLPALSRGLGLPLESLTAMLSARSALGMSSPFFGPIADRFGRRNAMLIGLTVFWAAMTLVALFPSYYTLFAAVILVVVCKFIFDPALQAHLGDRTAYSRRGLVIALTELAWSGAVLVGIPLAGFLIARGGWTAPFLPLAALGIAAGLGIWLVIPPTPPQQLNNEAGGSNHWMLVWRDPVTLAALSVGLLASAANENLNVVYGVWMEQSFGLSVVQLGLTTTVIGVAELFGEGFVAVIVDRLGKRRSIALGLAASAGAYFVLPLVASNIQFALVALFFVFITFEFCIVATIPLITELVPEARGATMSANVAFHAAGRMIGALAGAYLFRLGFVWNGAAAAALNVIGIPIVLWIVKERRD